MRNANATRLIAGKPQEALLEDAFIHLTSRRQTTLTLAKALGVSPATAFRIVKLLRAKGHLIVSMKEGDRWFFAVREKPGRPWKEDPLIRARGFVRHLRRSPSESLDDVIYAGPETSRWILADTRGKAGYAMLPKKPRRS